MQPPQIAVVGAGTSGNAVGAMLARQLGSRITVTVMERAPQVRDEGYGLDLDEGGQMALARAGVYHRYWDISVPLSDSWTIWNVTGNQPLARAFQPRLLQWLLPSIFGSRPETNRAGLRDAMLEAIEQSEGNHHIQYECKVHSVREVVGSGGGRVAELIDINGKSLGEYDLVIDAAGVNSPLRLNRVSDDVGVVFSKRVFIHGMFHNPEAVLSQQLLQRLSFNGNNMILGHGYSLVFQRYGAGPNDPRMCFFYYLDGIPDEDYIFKKIGFERPNSRATGLLKPGDPRMALTQAWLRNDMEGAVDPIWIEAIDKVDQLTIRCEYSHGNETALRDDVTLPIVCIGDALCNAGLGGGGVMALKDALELTDLIVPLLRDNDYVAGSIDMRKLLAPELVLREKEMLARKVEHRKRREGFKLIERKDDDFKSKADLAFNQHPSFLFRWGMPVLACISKAWWSLEVWWYGAVGSTSSSPIYYGVQKVLKQQKAAL